MTLRQHIGFWVGLVIVSLFALGLLADILLPFVAGMAVAFFLDPVADRLEALGLSRVMATTIITIIFFIVVILATVLLVPLIAGQALQLIEAAPDYMSAAKTAIQKLADGPLSRILTSGQDAASADAMTEFRQRALSYGAGVLQDVARGSAALVNFMGLVFITPVVSFYMLNDWDRIVAYIDKLLPRQNADTIRKIVSEIETVLAGFVRGMGTICLFLATFYAIGLELAGLQFGLVVGIFAGLISFIPFVGMAVGLLLAIMLGVFQFLPDNPGSLAIIAGIFITGQLIEGNILTPKLVGRKIGLHPVWVIFGLLALGSLFGFVGMLLAVPVAAAIGVVVRHFTAQYLASPLYWGVGAPIGSHARAPEPALEDEPEAVSQRVAETDAAQGGDENDGPDEGSSAKQDEAQ